MKIIIIALILIHGFICIQAQDLIFIKNNNDTIKCKIIEDKILYLKYKKYKSTDTTSYQISQKLYDYYIYDSNQNSSIKRKDTTITNQEINIKETNNESQKTYKEPERSYIISFNDSVISAKSIIFHCVDFELLLDEKVCNQEEVYLDGIKFPGINIKFIQAENYYYANTCKVNRFGKVEYAKRIKEGKINIFLTSKIGINTSSRGVPYYVFDTCIYYNKGSNNLKLTTFKNLKIDLADNVESMIYLKKSQSAKKSSVRCAIISTLSILGMIPLILFVVDINKPTHLASAIAIPCVTGITFAIRGLIKSHKVDKYKRIALFKYNN